MKRLFSMAWVAACVTLSVSSISWALSQADEIFYQAMAADQAGDTAKRDLLLSDALKADPQHKLARWYSGQVLHNGKWQSLDEIERTVSSDPRWQEYQDRIQSSEDTLADHQDIARWCRAQGLQLEEKWHWIHVLRHDPENREALGALGLRVYRGGYASAEEIAEIEADERKAKMAFKHYAKVLETAMRAAERSEGTRRASEIEKIAAINDPAAIPAIVEIVLADAKNEKRILKKFGHAKGEALLRQMQFAAVKALGNMPEHEATESLLEIAMYASDKDVRDQAARQLKHREPTSYMPQLMAGLSAPIEVEISVHALPNGEITVHEDFTEAGPLATRKHSRSSSFLTQHVNFHTQDNALNGTSRTRISTIWSDQWRDMANATAQISNTQTQVELENALRKERNARIERILELATDKKLGEDPQTWWSEWKEYNELYTPEELPVAETQVQYDHSRYVPHYSRSVTTRAYERTAARLVPAYERGRGMPGVVTANMPGYRPPVNYSRSCFAAGTEVWTQSGPVPIETIKVGDLVLSQNPHSGELDYRPVLDDTVRPPAATVKLTIHGETIVSTRGHRFWKTGAGWQMAKLLKSGEAIATLQGSADIEMAEEGDAVEAYNLEVGQFHTFFVGKNRVLVHDNTCPQPTINVLPGISPRNELTPAELALSN